jgi:hypothetical protein
MSKIHYGVKHLAAQACPPQALEPGIDHIAQNCYTDN